MQRRYIGILIIMPILLGVFYMLPSNVNAQNSPYILHDGIVIQSNDDFTSANGVIGGNGTVDDPYIIEGWEIEFNETSLSNIYILNTTAYLKIRNCKLKNVEFLGFNVVIISLLNVENVVLENIIPSDSSSIFHIMCMEVNNCNFTHISNIDSIYFLNSTSNSITYSTFGGASGSFAIEFDNTSTNNLLHHNNFLGSFNLSGIPETTLLSSGNIWDDGSEGNYWSDYTGEDKDHDGIYDSPFKVPLTEDYDRYPLVDPVQNAGFLQENENNPLTPFFPKPHEPFKPIVNEEVHFYGSAYGGEPPYAWYWEFGDGSISYEQNPTHIYTKEGKYIVNFTVTDATQKSVKKSLNIVVTSESSKNFKPIIKITKPAKDEVVSGKVNITGTASDPDGIISSIQVQISGSDEWHDANIIRNIHNYTTGNVTWYYIWDSSNVIPGEITIRAKAIDFDGLESDRASVTVTVEKTSSGGGGGTPGFEMILIVVAVLLVSMLFKRRKKP